MSDFNEKFEKLKDEAKEAARPHLDAIAASATSMKEHLDAIRALGLIPTVHYPYGRGEISEPTSIRVEVELRVKL